MCQAVVAPRNADLRRKTRTKLKSMLSSNKVKNNADQKEGNQNYTFSRETRNQEESSSEGEHDKRMRGDSDNISTHRITREQATGGSITETNQINR